MTPLAYICGLLLGIACCTAGATLLAGAPAGLLTAGVLVLGFTAFGAVQWGVR